MIILLAKIWAVVKKWLPRIKATIENQNHYNPNNNAETSTKEPLAAKEREPYGYPVLGDMVIHSRFRTLTRPYHNGVDVASRDWGAYSPEAGVVIEIVEPNFKTPAQWIRRDGKWLRIHPNDGTVPNPYIKIKANSGIYHYLVHSVASVTVGTRVIKHTRVGTWKGPDHPEGNGSWGNSNGQHIHWAIKINGKWVNPIKYSKGRMT